KWLQATARARPAFEQADNLQAEWEKFSHAQIAYLLGDNAYARVFPATRPAERITWSGYRNAAFPSLLKSQKADGNWGTEPGSIHATALRLMILQLAEGSLPLFGTVGVSR